MHLVEEQYQERLASAIAKIESEGRRKTSLFIVLGFLIALTLCVAVTGHPIVALALLIAGSYVGIGAQHARRRWLLAGRERDYFQRGIARLDGGWRQFEETGREFIREDHVYQDDLNVLGQNSLFQLLCTARTHSGAERIAAHLLESVERSESLRRQDAVRELTDRPELRETIDKLGTFRSQDCVSGYFDDWFAMPVLLISKYMQWLLASCSLLAFVLGMAVFCKALPPAGIWPWLVGLLIPPLTFGGWYMHEIKLRLEILRRLTGSANLLFEAIAFLDTQHFTSVKLRDLVSELKRDRASFHLRSLARIFEAIQQREKPYFAFSSVLAFGTQMVFWAERWRNTYQKQFATWLNAWMEFEALQAMAGLAYEHPEWTFPDLSPKSTCFEAKAMGHPLLLAGVCVRNDVRLDDARRYLLVSGSNMAGKSTLLRAIGLNTVLAYAGGPVCADQLTLTQMQLCTSISVHDSLSSGRSKFLAEVERLAVAIDSSRCGRKVLFLIDEILSGTNSEDRRVVAQAFVAEMLMGRTIGVLTSHDVSLVQALAERGVLTCMESSDSNDPLRFDYRLKPGAALMSSALAVARMAGIKIDS